jgi:hypothetical protein
MAVKREVQLQESHKDKKAKEQEIATLRVEMANLQEQVWHNERDVCVIEGFGNVFCGRGRVDEASYVA